MARRDQPGPAWSPKAMGCLFSKSDDKVDKLPKDDQAPEEDHGSLSGDGGRGLTGAKSPRKPPTVFTSDGPKPVPKARTFIEEDDDSPARPSGPSKVLKKRVPARLAEQPSNSAPEVDEVQDDLEAELARAKPKKGGQTASAPTVDPDAEAIAAEVEKLKRRKKDKSRLTDLDSDEDLDPSEEGTREELLRRRAAQRTSTVGMSSGVRKKVFGKLDDLSDDENSGQLMAPALSSAPVLGGHRPLLAGSGRGRPGLAPLKPLGGISNGPALGSFLAPVRRPAGKSVPAEQEKPVSLYQQRQQEERQPSPVQVSAPPEKVDDEEDFVWKDDEEETLAAPRGHVQEIEPAAPSVSQLEDDDEADLVWRDDEEEPPQAAQPLVPPEAPDDEEVERVWRDDEASTPGRDEYEHDVFETDETKPETPGVTMLEEMIGETEQYVVEEDDDFEPEELPESSPESQGAVTPAAAAKLEDSLVLEDATPVPFTPSSEPMPPEDDWGGDDMDDGFEAGGEIDYEDAAVVDEDESEDDVW